MTRTEKLIADDEGFISKITPGPRGKRNIGYGFNLDRGMDREEAYVLLKFDIDRIRERLRYELPFFNGLSAKRQDVLISIAYNLGVHGLLGFEKMLAAVEEKGWYRAKYEILDSDAARELPNRYGRLAEMMIEG